MEEIKKVIFILPNYSALDISVNMLNFKLVCFEKLNEIVLRVREYSNSIYY